MQLQVNGKSHQLESGERLSDLLESLSLQGRPVVVELNGEALISSEHAGVRLKDGDCLEIVSIVAGG